MRPSSSVEMMPSIGMPYQSPTTGLVAVKSLTTEIACAQVSPSSSSEEVDYSRSDVDWDNVCPALDSSKFSHLATEEMGVISIGGNL